MGEWIKVERGGKKPRNTARGTAVLVYGKGAYPWEVKPRVYEAFFGKRITGREGVFYIGGTVVNPTHWMPMPEPPEGSRG